MKTTEVIVFGLLLLLGIDVLDRWLMLDDLSGKRFVADTHDGIERWLVDLLARADGCQM